MLRISVSSQPIFQKIALLTFLVFAFPGTAATNGATREITVPLEIGNKSQVHTASYQRVVFRQPTLESMQPVVLPALTHHVKERDPGKANPRDTAWTKVPYKRKRPIASSARTKLLPEEVLVVGYDSQGVAQFMTRMIDPRAIRAEYTDERGKLINEGVVFQAKGALNIDIPADKTIKTIILYKSSNLNEHRAYDDLSVTAVFELP